MFYFLNFLQLFLMSTVSMSFAENPMNMDVIRPGVFISSANPENACVISIRDESNLILKDRYSVQVARKAQAVYPALGDFAMFDVTSDIFSMEDLKKQMEANNGEFSLVTKETKITKNTLMGKLVEVDEHIFLEMSVSSNTCIGLCTGDSSHCRVQLK